MANITKIGIGICFTVTAAAVLGTTPLSFSFLGLLAAGQALAQVPDLGKYCCRSLDPDQIDGKSGEIAGKVLVSSKNGKEPHSDIRAKIENPGPDYLNILPDEVLVNIRSSLNKPDEQALNCTCKNLGTANSPKLVARKRFELMVQSKDNDNSKVLIKLDELMWCGDQFTSSENFELDLNNTNISDDKLKSIVERFPNIESINLTGCRNLTNEGFKYLASLKNLKVLNLTNTQISDAGLEYFGQMTSLTNLTLRCCREITDAGAAHLCKLTNLISLDLGFTKITDAGLISVAVLKNLTDLNLDTCVRITSAGLLSLIPVSKLTKLNLNGCYQITNVGLAYVSQMKNLKEIVLRNLGRISDAGVAYLRHMTNLTSLDISHTKITNTGLFHVAAMKSLIHLNLDNCFRITDAGLVPLSQLPNLTSLNMSNTWITDAGLIHMAALTNLESLDLMNNLGITIDGLPYLKRLTKLTSLNLVNCRVTDEGLPSLAEMTNLKRLQLYHLNCWITEAGVTQLSHLRNDMTIIIPFNLQSDILFKDGAKQICARS